MSEDLRLAAPCIWCGYKGPNYWQAGTHEVICPCFNISGIDERQKMLLSRSETLRTLRAERDRVLRERDEAAEETARVDEIMAKAMRDMRLRAEAAEARVERLEKALQWSITMVRALPLRFDLDAHDTKVTGEWLAQLEEALSPASGEGKE